jgi:hypothetical protein
MSSQTKAPDVFEYGGVYFSPDNSVVHYRGETKVLTGFTLDVVRSLFSAARKRPEIDPEILVIGCYSFDPSNGKLSGEGVETLYFSPSESILFATMARNLNKMVPAKVLNDGLVDLRGGAAVFLDTDIGSTRRLDVFICIMRRKLRKHGYKIEIGTKFGFGRGMILPDLTSEAELGQMFQYRRRATKKRSHSP